MAVSCTSVASVLLLALVPLAPLACTGADGEGIVDPADGSLTDTASNEVGSETSGETSGETAPDDTTVADSSDDSSDGGVTCPGLGTFCGSRFGLDPTKLYNCNDSKVVGVARDCGAKCIEVADAAADICPCPAGDGTYCGDRVGGDSNKLYDCKAGKLTEAAQCAPKCTAGTAASDKCAPCASGNGAYCGITVGADKNKLYNCTDGVLTVKSDCGAACVVKPPGVADVCPGCSSGDGLYCGGAVGLDPNTLYNCKAGVFTVAEKCGTTCFIAPAGTSDYCTSSSAGLLCSSIQWWNSALTYGPYMSYGWWDTDLAVPNMSKVQLRHPSKLEKEGVYGWGWMPEFTDTVTGKRFRFLHLQPTAKYTTAIGTVYPAGTIVGLSGGASAATGYPTYSTGAHLCVQTIEKYRDCFPTGTDACK